MAVVVQALDKALTATVMATATAEALPLANSGGSTGNSKNGSDSSDCCSA